MNELTFCISIERSCILIFALGIDSGRITGNPEVIPVGR